MTTTTDAATTAQVPQSHEFGLSETIRAHRLFLGLTQREMARLLHQDRRNYQHIESGRNPCPPGMLSQIEVLSDRFAYEVELILDEADRRDPADGPLTVAVTTDGTDEDTWQRNVAGRAAVEATEDHPIVLVAAPAQKPS